MTKELTKDDLLNWVDPDVVSGKKISAAQAADRKTEKLAQKRRSRKMRRRVGGVVGT